MLDVTRTVVEEEIKDKYKWELKPLSNQIIDDENISNEPVLGKLKKLAFQCPLMGCKSNLKNISSVIDHLNNIHRVPRGENLWNMTRHTQKHLFFCKRGGKRAI